MKIKYKIPIITIGVLLGILFIPLVDAVETESGAFAWKFCDQEKQSRDYKGCVFAVALCSPLQKLDSIGLSPTNAA